MVDSVCDTHSLMRNAAIAKYARVGRTHNMHYHNTAAVKPACMLTNSLVPTKKLDGSYSSSRNAIHNGKMLNIQ